MTRFSDLHRRRQAGQAAADYYDLDPTCHIFYVYDKL
jgi:hypothetical protein